MHFSCLIGRQFILLIKMKRKLPNNQIVFFIIKECREVQESHDVQECRDVLESLLAENGSARFKLSGVKSLPELCRVFSLSS